MWASGELSLTFDGLGLIWLLQEAKPENSLVVLRNFEKPQSKTKRKMEKDRLKCS